MAASGTFSAPRGMRDFYPAEMAQRQALFDAWRQAAEAFGFAAYDAPVVETLGLLKRKSGEEIVDQIYTMVDKSGRELALRPEMTPSLARLVASRQGELRFPIKWYAIAQCFRYERTTRGRKREHYQWNLDVIGEPSVRAEVEVLATAARALAVMGLTAGHYTIRYSSRRLLTELLASLDIDPSHHEAAFLVLDKRGKMDDDVLRGLLNEAGLDAAQSDAVFDLMTVATLEDAAQRVGDTSPALTELREFLDGLRAYGLEDLVTFDVGVIRGLSYYTGIVFEAFDTGNTLRAIFGGGRYDNLLSDVGGRPATGVGLGFGDVVIAELLEALDLMPAARAPATLAIGYMSDDQRLPAMQLARQCRDEGTGVDLGLSAEKPKAFFSRAGGGGYREAIYIGPDDVERGVVRVKTLADRSEREIPLP